MTVTDTIALDHLLIASPDLDSGCDYAEDVFGVRPVAGGSHPGIGTRNALLGLEDNIYIEVIAPDPGQGSDPPLSHYLSNLNSPHFMWWAVRCDDIEKIRVNLIANQIDVGDAESWSRELPDGRRLAWRLLMPRESSLGSVMPFFIQWDDMGSHPAKSLPVVGKLTSFRVSHPDASRLKFVLGERFAIDQQADAGLAAEIAANGGPASLLTTAGLPPAIGCIREAGAGSSQIGRIADLDAAGAREGGGQDARHQIFSPRPTYP